MVSRKDAKFRKGAKVFHAAAQRLYHAKAQRLRSPKAQRVLRLLRNFATSRETNPAASPRENKMATILLILFSLILIMLIIMTYRIHAVGSWQSAVAMSPNPQSAI